MKRTAATCCRPFAIQIGGNAMEFTKMHGVGNDYILLNCTEHFPADPAELSRKLSDRHFGIGSDGIICICPSEQADFQMKMYNADGSEGAMCGNGIRCAAKFAFEKKLTEKQSILFETKAGLRKVELELKGGKISSIEVNMGAVTIGEILDIDVKGKTYTGVAVEAGNLHFVIPDSVLDATEVQMVGEALQKSALFPDGVNVELVKVLCRGKIQVRVWERGSGETLACGTGACAAAAVMNAMGRTERRINVRMPGGDLEVFYCDKDRKWHLRGPAETVFEGRINGMLW